MADYRQLAGALTNSDTIQATPRNPVLGGVADLLGMAYKLPEMPRMGVPGIDFLAANRKKVLDLLGMGDVQKTADALSYGFPVGTGKGMTYKLNPETIGAALAIAPFAGKAIRATEGLPIGGSIKFIDDVAPQAEALRLAQQRAALPVEQGGLGLPATNTAMDRAKTMGGKDMVHFSRSGGDYATLDSGKFAIAPFDAVGTHVGTPGAAMERFQNTTGYKVNNPDYVNDELRSVTYPVTILGDRPMMNQNNMPFGEDDLNTLLRQQSGHNWSDIQGGKMSYQDMNAGLRKKLFEDQGYTSIPYFNEVEGKGSVSYIVPPENIRSRFAVFDPFRRNAATAAIMGVAAPDLLATQKK
jgi:hypothetical protein